MAQILLLGPDRERAVGVRSLLRKDGHQVAWLKSVDNWLGEERALRPDVVVAAVGTTAGVLGHRGANRGRFAAPLLFVQQESDFVRDPFVADRLVDRMASPYMGEELLGRVDALIRVRQVVRRESPGEALGRRQDSPRRLHGFGERVNSWLRARFPTMQKPVGPYLEVAARVADWADRRDAFEPGHAERVTSFCAMIAEGLGMEESETAGLLRAAMLHDIGKVALPVEMLHQQGPLEDSQVRMIQTHPARGAALLRALDPDEQVARVVLYHHECPDGGGYYGKSSEGIPKASYALAVAETYDAMTSSRVGATLSSDRALDRLREMRGSRYDSDCVDALVDLLKPRGACIPLSAETIPLSRT